MKFKLPPRLQRGDRVAILSPSAGLPSVFPWVYELGLKRLKEVFHLEPVPFPTALQSIDELRAHPEARARDVNDAFADPTISAIIATIGGNDEIEILPFLDRECIAAHPKPFLGYSDNTNLHLFLWQLGIISSYGGNLMNQFAMQGEMHPYTEESIHKALFEESVGEIHAAEEWTDCDLDWRLKTNLEKTRPMSKNEGWVWHNHEGKKVEGRLWGGCLEVLEQHLGDRRYLPTAEQARGTVLYLETSEEIPEAEVVYEFVRKLHGCGLLSSLHGLLVGRPKTQFCGTVAKQGSVEYQRQQREAVKRALQECGCSFPVVFQLDFGHTDPQVLVPNGGVARIDGVKQKIWFSTE